MTATAQPTTIVDPIGCREVAAMLRIKQSSVDQMRFRAQANPSDRTLPEPDAIVSTTLIWSRATIEEWAIRTGRMPAE